MKRRRTLYECNHARVKGSRIRCRRGYTLSPRTEDGGVDIKRLAAGEELALSPCRGCRDFDCNGPPVPPGERGWLKKKVTK